MNATEKARGNRLRPQSLFLGLILVFGLAVLAANPPFQAPDEFEHFFRAFQLSEGTFVGKKWHGNAGGSLPAVLDVFGVASGLPFHPEKKMTYAIWGEMSHPVLLHWRGAPRSFFFFPHIVLYSPAGYLPQTLGILLGKLLSVGPLGLLYLARLSGFAACAGLGYAALRRAPIFRWSLMLVLLAPMSLYLMGSVAQDGILLAGASLLTALLMRLATDPHRRAGWREQAAILVLAALLPVAKFVYFPLAAVTPFLVLPRLPSSRAKAAFGAAYVVFCLLPVLAWAHVIASLYTPGRIDIPTDPATQLRHVLKDPLAFLLQVAQSLIADCSSIYKQFVGVLGWLDTPLPKWFYSAYGLGFVACLVLESGEARRVSWRQRFLLVGAVAATVVLTYAAIYAQGSSPGSTGPIGGIQGRYFLPLAPLLVVAIPPCGRIRAPAWAPSVLAAALAATSAAVCLWAVVVRYYVESPPTEAPVLLSYLHVLCSTRTDFAFRLRATNGSVKFSATGLPAGLNLDGSSGWIRGRPARAGAAVVGVTATNSAGSTKCDFIFEAEDSTFFALVQAPKTCAARAPVEIDFDAFDAGQKLDFIEVSDQTSRKILDRLPAGQEERERWHGTYSTSFSQLGAHTITLRFVRFDAEAKDPYSFFDKSCQIRVAVTP